MRALAKQTVRDFRAPFSGGWASIYGDFARTLPGTLNPRDVAQSELLLAGEAPIGPFDFARRDMLIGFAYSHAPQPMSFGQD